MLTAESPPGLPAFRFSGFRLDRRGGGLARWPNNGEPVEPVVLGSRALDVLTVLVERRGELVTKQALMEAVWPGIAVEDSNLAVQISALRRILDEDRAGKSVIQTVIGRGYRFLAPVEMEAETPPVRSAAASPTSDKSASTNPAPSSGMPGPAASAGPYRWARRYSLQLALGAAMVLGGAALSAPTVWRAASVRWTVPLAAPRLSLVVLPFQNLSGDPSQDYLADGITDDLTTDLSLLPEVLVIGGASARALKGRAEDVKWVGRELGVRYVVEGSVRRAGATLHVNVQLVSTETAAHVWSDLFDEPFADLANGHDAILARLRGTLGVSLIAVEAARGRRAPPASPDAFDLILRARALRNQPYSVQRYDEALSLYEQALRLDASSVLALMGAAAMLLDQQLRPEGWRSFEARRRVETLLARARDIAPASAEYRGVYAYWLSGEGGGCRRSMAAMRAMIETYANPYFGYGLLSNCLITTGHSEDAIPLAEKAIRLNPFGPGLHTRLTLIGSAHLFLGHDEEAIRWLEQALSVNPDLRDNTPGGTKRKLAAAYARAGRDVEARHALVAADKDWPFDTVRGHWPDDPNPIFAAQVRAYQEGLRRAGERDHADEDADFGLPADADLRVEYAGRTPTTAPGAITIRTADLPGFLAERKPLVIDPLLYFWGNSLPGAIGLRNAGIGGSLTDEAQDRLGRAMSGLTGGDLARPIVVVGWNAERFDGRNLALRLVALGYTNVVWYRGGREAWEVAGLPETELIPQDW